MVDVFLIDFWVTNLQGCFRITKNSSGIRKIRKVTPNLCRYVFKATQSNSVKYKKTSVVGSTPLFAMPAHIHLLHQNGDETLEAEKHSKQNETTEFDFFTLFMQWVSVGPFFVFEIPFQSSTSNAEFHSIAQLSRLTSQGP